MINRILIRIKVIQILYSFLLVEKNFALEGMPTAPTKEKRFAYSLYLDLLALLVKVSQHVERRQGERPLEDTGFISRLLNDESFKIYLKRLESEPFTLSAAVGPVSRGIEESGIYKIFLKDTDKNIGAPEQQLWQDLFNHVVMTNPVLNALIQERQNYTLKGLERARDMVSRTFVNYLASQDNVDLVEKSLSESLDKARELYMRLLYLPVELTQLEARKIDENRYKFLKTAEDINPNLRFADNKMIARLEANPELAAYIEKNKISWLNEDPVMMQNLLKAIKNSDIYLQYMQDADNDIHKDAELWRQLLKNVILENVDFLENMEEKSVFWNDDLDIISTFVLKTFRRLEEDNVESAILDKYKDDEDARFGSELLRYLYRDKESYRRYIDATLEGGRWDKDRLAFMDIVIMETALAEIMNFPKIPLQVSLNEYIELAKSYSSVRSGQFVHGILGTVVSRLQKEGKLLKR